MRLLTIILTYLLIIQFNMVFSQTTGEYYNKSKSQILNFCDDTFVYKYSNSGIPFNCSDTIAFGNWKNIKGNKLLQVSSTPRHLEGLVNIRIIEEVNSTHKETVVFNISNPIEDNWRQFNSNNEEARLVFYRIRLTTDCDAPKRILEKDFFSSKIEFEVPFSCEIKSFEILVLPVDLEMWMQTQPPRLVRTEEYNIVERNANNFIVTMPQLSECYMSALPLSNDIVVVKSKDVLLWRGEVFEREK